MSLQDNSNQMRRRLRNGGIAGVFLALAATVSIAGGQSTSSSGAPPQSKLPPASHTDTPKEEPQESTIRVDVDLVNILFTVHTKKGQLIPNLEKSNFTIREDNQPQTIQHFSRETDLPLTLGLLIDISASQERLIEVERQAASSFFSSVVRPKDEAFLISFGKSIELLQDYTNSSRRLTAGLEDLRGDGQTPMLGGGPVNTGPVPTSGTPKGTLMFDAVYLAANEKLKSEVGRKAMVLITDGGDQGSTYDRRAAIEAAQRADSIIYSIYYVDRGFNYGSISFGGGGESELRKMSEETGGRVFTVSNKHPLSEIFKEIQDELRNQYSIAYAPANANRDGSFRHIQIATDNSEYKVQARNGYYATRNDAR
jgi:VWFA-related protein